MKGRVWCQNSEQKSSQAQETVRLQGRGAPLRGYKLSGLKVECFHYVRTFTDSREVCPGGVISDQQSQKLCSFSTLSRSPNFPQLFSVRFKEASFKCGCSGEESACPCRGSRRCGFNPQVRKIPQRKKWQPTPVYLPEKSHGERSLVGYRPWGRREWDTAERLSSHREDECKVGELQVIPSRMLITSLKLKS